MNKKSILVTSILIALIAGYFAGAFIGWPVIDKSQSQGNISNLNGSFLGDLNSDFDSQILNDSVLSYQTAYFHNYIQSRAYDFVVIVKMSADATKNISELQEQNTLMRHLYEMIINVQSEASNAILAYNNVLLNNGDGSLEYLSKKAILDYLLLSNTMSQNLDYISAVDEFMVGRNSQSYLVLERSRTLWNKFNANESSENRDEELLEYFSEMGYELPQELAEI